MSHFGSFSFYFDLYGKNFYAMVITFNQCSIITNKIYYLVKFSIVLSPYTKFFNSDQLEVNIKIIKLNDRKSSHIIDVRRNLQNYFGKYVTARAKR